MKCRGFLEPEPHSIPEKPRYHDPMETPPLPKGGISRSVADRKWSALRVRKKLIKRNKPPPPIGDNLPTTPYGSREERSVFYLSSALPTARASVITMNWLSETPSRRDLLARSLCKLLGIRSIIFPEYSPRLSSLSPGSGIRLSVCNASSIHTRVGSFRPRLRLLRGNRTRRLQATPNGPSDAWSSSGSG